MCVFFLRCVVEHEKNVYDAKSCMNQNCQVPFCTNLKIKIQKQGATSMQAMMQKQTSTMQPEP